MVLTGLFDPEYVLEWLICFLTGLFVSGLTARAVLVCRGAYRTSLPTPRVSRDEKGTTDKVL